MKSTLRIGAAIVVLTGMLALTACTSEAASSGAAPSQAPSAELSAEAQAALDIVNAHTAATDDFTAPGPTVDGSALEGKTVYYVPLTLGVPLLNIIGQELGDALATVGAKVQICDAKANPADAASCLQQAVDGGAGAVVTASITPDFAPAAFDAVMDAGIPLVQGITSPDGDLDPNQAAYVTADNVAMQTWSTNWVIADSDAQANVLVVKLTDSPVTEMWADAGILAVYESGCAECSVQVLEINSGTRDKLPSLVSSALLANPEVTHIQAQFDQFLPGVTQGLQAAGREDIRVISVDGLLSTLQELEAGGNVKASVAFNQTALSWYLADAAVRLASGNEAVLNLEFPFRRVFTEGNIDELALTPEAQSSGEWFGKADYVEGFTTLWGAN